MTHVIKRPGAGARGYFVDTVGRDTEKIRSYIRKQDGEDRRRDQLEFPDVSNKKPTNKKERKLELPL